LWHCVLMFCYFVCVMPYMMVLARRVGAETQLQRVTAGWCNQLLWETVDIEVLELCSDQWSLHQRCFLIWRLVYVTFGCVTLPRRFRLGIVFGGEVWRSVTQRHGCELVLDVVCCELLLWLHCLRTCLLIYCNVQFCIGSIFSCL